MPRWIPITLFISGLSACPGCTVLIGDACSASAPCGVGTVNTSYICDTTQPGGYCTRPCSVVGDTRECRFSGDQLDGICARPGDGGDPQCALRCIGDGECRAGYRCLPVLDAGFGCGPWANGE